MISIVQVSALRKKLSYSRRYWAWWTWIQRVSKKNLCINKAGCFHKPWSTSEHQLLLAFQNTLKQLSQHLEPRAASTRMIPSAPSAEQENPDVPLEGARVSLALCPHGRLSLQRGRAQSENTWQLHSCHIPAQCHLVRPSIRTEPKTQTPDVKHETMEKVLIYTITGPRNSTLHNLILKECLLF